MTSSTISDALARLLDLVAKARARRVAREIETRTTQGLPLTEKSGGTRVGNASTSHGLQFCLVEEVNRLLAE